jgi:hypothetical protein
MKILLISGSARHGKDTFATFLKEYLDSNGFKTQHVHFSDELKKQALECGWSGLKDEAGRKFLQEFGEERNAVDKYYWSKMLHNQIESDSDYIIVADARHRHEINYFNVYTEYDITTIRIERYNLDGSFFENDLTPEQRAHISEIDLKGFAFDFLFKIPSDDKKEFSKFYATWFGNLLTGGKTNA